MSDTDTMRRLADRFVAAVENSDATALDAIYAQDAVVWRNYDRRAQPRDENIAGIAKFPEQHVASGVKTGGESFRVPVCMVIAIRGGRIARIDEYFDSAQDARLVELR